MDPTPDPPPPAEPPLVTRVTAPLPPRPRPGLFEAVLWCVVLWVVQLAGFLITAAIAFGVQALLSGEPRTYAEQEFGGFGSSVKAPPPGTERPPLPAGIASGFAWGFLGAQGFMLGFSLLVIPRRVGADWKRQLGVRRPAGLHLLLAVLVLPAFMILSSGLVELLVKWGVKPLPGADALRGVFGAWPAWLTVLAVGVGPGVVEELWCRGFLGRGLCARYGLTAGVVATSVLFALLHLHPGYALVYALMGAFLHFTYLCSRSLWVPILLHALNNGVAVLAEVSGVLVQFSANPSGLSPVLFLASFALLAFATAAFWTGRAEVQPWGRAEIDWKPEYPGVSAPPAGVEARIGYRPVSPVALVNTFLSLAAVIYLLTMKQPG